MLYNQIKVNKYTHLTTRKPPFACEMSNIESITSCLVRCEGLSRVACTPDQIICRKQAKLSAETSKVRSGPKHPFTVECHQQPSRQRPSARPNRSLKMSASKPILRTCLNTRQAPSLLPLVQRRAESTARRHKKLLALPEAPSYTPSRSQPTLIFNPPSAAPSVYHTPLKFLPKEDKRRALYTAALAHTTTTSLRRQSSPIAAPGTPLSTTSHLPPRPSAALPAPVRAPYEKKYHLTVEDIEQIRALRLEDPDKWTRVKLAEKFGCSQFFVGMVAKAKDKAERVEAEHQKARERWGSRRREAREERGRRKMLWGRDL